MIDICKIPFMLLLCQKLWCNLRIHFWPILTEKSTYNTYRFLGIGPEFEITIFPIHFKYIAVGDQNQMTKIQICQNL